jgi:hypothetical protein
MRIPRPRVGRRVRLPGILALQIALLAGLAAQAGPASAATAALHTAASNATATRQLTSSGRAGTSAVTRPKARKLAEDPREQAWRSRFIAHPVPAPRATARAIPATTSRTLRQAAARDASREATVSTCSGPILADTLYSCQNPSSTGTDTYTLTLPAGPNVLVFQTTDVNAVALPITVTAPDETTVSCQQSPVDECATSQQGTYTISVASDDVTYTLEYMALLTETNCPALSLSFAAPSANGSLTAGQTGNCYSFSGTSGHIVYVFPAPGGYQEVGDVAIFDAAGNLVCAQLAGNCTLTGAGPYRVLASNSGGELASYQFQVADLTDPAGCAPVAQQVFGQVPALSADLCSSLTVTTAGGYQIYAVSKEFATFPATLYLPSGGSACTGTGWACQLAPGTYNFVQNYTLDGDEAGTVFINAAQTRGCVAASDTSFASGDATASFAGAGEELCRTLPTRAGLSDYLYSQPVTSGSQGQVLGVVDSTGTQVCPDAFAYWSFGTCTLTGTAPFRVILVPSGADSQVRLLVQRTDSTAGCAAWPRSGYGNAAGAHVTLTVADNAKCFVIPPAGRAAAELVEDADSTDGAQAALVVNDPSGNDLCTGNGYPTDWTICDYKAGVTYTAILVETRTPIIGVKDTYWLARRDVTGHAACSSPVSTSPGGPTTSFTLGSSVAARCFRVSAAKADKLMAAFRDSAPTDSSAFDTPPATILITNSSGALVCDWELFCPATGSAGYQVIVLTVDYTDVAITAELNPWLVATSAGWAPACQRHQFSSAANSPTVTDTLTDASDVYCAVLNVQPNQAFYLYGSDTAISPSGLWVNAYTAGSWANQNLGVCGSGAGPWCELGPDQQATQALLIVAPYGSSQDPIGFDLQGVCVTECSAARPTPVYKSINVTAQAAGPDNTVVLTGTGLNFGTPFDLFAQDGSEYSPAVPVSVNAAGTRLTLQLDTTQVPPATYDISAGDYCSPAPCSDWLLNAYTVTSAPAAPPATRFVPLTPARILDTQTGLGTRRARVPAHATVTFPVTGRAGVPSSRVGAVVLDVSAVAPSRAGYLTVFAAGRSRPPAETTAFQAGRSMTGLVTIPVVNGRVAVYNGSPGTVDLTADVLGYDTTAATTGTLLTPVGPVRILNPARIAAGHALALKVAGAGGVAARGAGAVVLDVTVSGPAKAGRLIAYADGTRRPAVTSLSFSAGQRVTEMVIARVSDGKADLYNASGGSLGLTVDAVGYYSATGSVFHPVNALRVMDTRSGFGGAGEAISPYAAAKLNPLWNTVLPSGADVTAVVLNVTVLGAKSAGALTVFPDGVLYQDGVALPNSTSLPGTPNIAFLPGQAESNLVIVPTSNLADFYNGSGGNLQVVADLEGYFTT